MFLVFFISLFFYSSALASFISLNTTVTAKVVGSQLKVLVSAVNKGDEPAYSVQAELQVGDKKILAEKKEKVEIDGDYKGYAAFNLNLINPGQYPLIVVMHYADANQYPFSALTIPVFNFKAEDVPVEIFGRMRSATFWKEGQLGLTLKNSGNTTINAKTNLVVPQELTVQNNQQDIAIAGRASAHTSFNIENFSALSGSTYQVYAVSEYDKDGRHHTVITPGMIKIVEKRNILGLDYQYLLIFLVILVMVFIIFQVFKSEKK